jgi:hypothetical protein
MRAYIDEPSRDTTLARLLGDMGSKFQVWGDMAHRPLPLSTARRQDQQLLPDIPDSITPGTTMPLNSTPGAPKLGTKAFYINQNGSNKRQICGIMLSIPVEWTSDWLDRGQRGRCFCCFLVACHLTAYYF